MTWHGSDLRVEQAEILHGLLPASHCAYVRLITQGTHSVVDALLFDDGREVGLEAAFAERTRAVSHGDHLRMAHAFRIHHELQCEVTVCFRACFEMTVLSVFPALEVFIWAANEKSHSNRTFFD